MAIKDNKVKCDMTNVPATKDMNDRDCLNDCLLNAKDLLVSMTIFLNECSNEQLHSTVEKMFKKIKQTQRDLFNLAWSNGWYILETAEKNKISEKKKELIKRLKEV